MSVIEKAELPVEEDKAEEFAAVLTKVADLLLAKGGCRTLTFGRGIERPNVFLVIATWDSVEHHMTFRDDPQFAEFVGQIKPYLVGATGMEHFTPLVER